jgi:beta-glucosidase
MRTIITLIIFCLLQVNLFSQYVDANKNGKMDVYENPKANIDVRVEDLLSRMTLQEKIAQMENIGKIQFDKQENLSRKTIDEIKNGIGHLSRTGEDLMPAQTVEEINKLQKYLIKKTRLGIPAIIHEECLHGLMLAGATVFPQAIAMASSWNVSLEEKVTSAIAQETRSRGANLALTPDIDLAKDPRYGRTGATFGEDPYLTSQFAIASINGFQGKNYLIGKDHIGATVKHFGASGQPLGGLNLALNYMSKRAMLESDLLPFRAAVEKAGVASVMAAYNVFDGIPCHANHWLLTKLLRNTWGYKGIVVSDYSGIEQLADFHFVAKNFNEAAKMSIEAGVDEELPKTKTFKNLKQMVDNGNLDVKYINRAVKNILRLKFRLGLFDNAYADSVYAKKVNHSDEHISLALKAAQESIILLKNENKTLPINLNKIKSIAVIGPNAKHAYYGGYTTRSSYGNGVTVYDGIKNYVGGKVKVNYAEGCKIHKGSGYWREPEAELNSEASDLKLINEAVKVAENSDYVVLVIGGTPRTSRESTGSRIGDRDDLNLFGRQQLLVDSIMKLNKPTVVYLMNGRPLSIVKVKKEVPAVLEGWYEGEQTGNAVADVLFGKINPSGKLPISFPRSVGDLPCYYNKVNSALHNKYILEKKGPLFPFGFGLSYTNFEYSDLKLYKNEISKDDSTTVSVKVTNTGGFDGKEIVQMYIHDNIASVARPVLELKGFRKIFLKKGESKIVEFKITPEKLKLLNQKMEEVVEPGKFTIYVGKNSADLQSIELTVID